MHWEAECEVEAPAETVWSILTEIDDAPTFMTTMSELERIGGPPYGVGTRWRETRRHGRGTIKQVLEVTVADPPHHTVVVSDAYGLRNEAQMRVEPTAGGARVLFSFDVSVLPETGRLKGWLASTASRIGERTAREMMAQDLDDIRAEAERRAREGGGVEG